MTDEEKQTQREQLKRMDRIACDFYAMCQQGRVPHAFLEFCGFMRKYVDVCRKALEQGVDIENINVHVGPLDTPLQVHDLEYLAEKFSCIFAPWINTQERLNIFLSAGKFIPQSSWKQPFESC